MVEILRHNVRPVVQRNLLSALAKGYVSKGYVNPSFDQFRACEGVSARKTLNNKRLHGSTAAKGYVSFKFLGEKKLT